MAEIDGLHPPRPFYAGLADQLHSLPAEGEAMRKSFFAAILSVGLLAETAVPVIIAATTTQAKKNNRSSGRRRRARNVGVGAAGGAAAGAIIGRGRGAGAGAVIGGTAGALTPTRRRR